MAEIEIARIASETTEIDRLRTLCEQKLSDQEAGGLKARLDEELKHIDHMNEAPYFLQLHGDQCRFAENENNLLVAALLGLCDGFDQNKPPRYEYGEFPDIDVDYIPVVRDYLKQDYCPREFGEEFVCDISTYTKFGIRSAIIDMARVLGLDRKEAINLTTELKVKDDEGDVLTWDKAVELYDDLREYLNRNPELGDAAKRLLNRNRGMGVHASGLIIAGKPIGHFVPLVKPKQDGKVAAAWPEGLSGTDLGAVGLVKFDFLSLDGLPKIAESIRMATEADQDEIAQRSSDWLSGQMKEIAIIKEAVGDEKVSALPGSHNWSDLSYLNDPKSLAAADKGDLRMVFQFDGSPAIRRLARQGGVTAFEDLVAYSALFRPGPMKCLEKHTNIKTKTGEVEIKDLSPAEHQVAYLDSNGEVQHTANFVVQRGPKKPMYRLKTKSGKEIIASAEHPLMDGNGKFVMLKNLKPKMIISALSPTYRCSDLERSDMRENGDAVQNLRRRSGGPVLQTPEQSAQDKETGLPRSFSGTGG